MTSRSILCIPTESELVVKDCIVLIGGIIPLSNHLHWYVLALQASVKKAAPSNWIGLDSLTLLPFTRTVPGGVVISVAVRVTAGPVWSTIVKFTAEDPIPAGVWL